MEDWMEDYFRFFENGDLDNSFHYGNYSILDCWVGEDKKLFVMKATGDEIEYKDITEELSDTAEINEEYFDEAFCKELLKGKTTKISLDDYLTKLSMEYDEKSSIIPWENWIEWYVHYHCLASIGHIYPAFSGILLSNDDCYDYVITSPFENDDLELYEYDNGDLHLKATLTDNCRRSFLEELFSSYGKNFEEYAVA